jgi:hypothetical protein
MREEIMKLFAGAGLALLMLAASPAAIAQATYTPPKTSWGVPDLQGVWSNASITKLTRMAGANKLVLTPEEVAGIEKKDFNNARTAIEKLPTDQSQGAPEKKALPSVGNYNAVWVDPGSKVASIRGELRSSFITDPPNGRVPMSDAGRKKQATWRPDAMRDGTFKPGPINPLSVPPPKAKGQKQAAAKQVKAGAKGSDGKAFIDLVEAPKSANGGGAADAYMGPESRGTGERCVLMGNLGGPVMLSGLYNNNIQVVQAPGHVMLEVEMIHDARIIPVFKDAAEARRNHGPQAIAKWMGDSVAWYEGDTLVVETNNYNRQQAGQVFISDTGTLTERITRVGENDIVYAFTVEDPEVYTQVWKGEIPWRKLKESMYEYACHEGNYGLWNILTGAREQERTGRALAVTALEE